MKYLKELEKLKKQMKKEAEEMTKEFINYYSQNICNESKPRVGVLNFFNLV